MANKNISIFDDTCTNNVIIINRKTVSSQAQLRRAADVITNMSRLYSNKAVKSTDCDRAVIGRMIALN